MGRRRRPAWWLVPLCLASTLLATALPVRQAVARGVERRVVVAAAPDGGRYWSGSSELPGSAAPIASSAPAVPPVPARIALYGDSMAAEAGQDFAFLAGIQGAVVRVRAFPGTALCDFLASMTLDAENWHPTAAVLAFSGDAFSPCMQGDQLGSPQYFAKYRGDTQTAISIFRSVAAKVILVGLPVDASARLSQNASALNQIYQAVADTGGGVAYDDAGRAVSSNGQFTWTLPCLSSEPCTGQAGTNIVRAPDGVHFCPDGRTTLVAGLEECDVYSSGAFRFASAMLAPILGTSAADPAYHRTQIRETSVPGRRNFA